MKIYRTHSIMTTMSNIKTVVDAVSFYKSTRGEGCCLEGPIDMGFIDDESLKIAEEHLNFRCSCGKCSWSESEKLPHPECKIALDALRSISEQERRDLFERGWVMCDEVEEIATFDERSLARANDFLKSIICPEPIVSIGPENSTDVHWRLDNVEIVVNFPSDISMPITCYVDVNKGSSIEVIIKGQDNCVRDVLNVVFFNRKG